MQRTHNLANDIGDDFAKCLLSLPVPVRPPQPPPCDLPLAPAVVKEVESAPGDVVVVPTKRKGKEEKRQKTKGKKHEVVLTKEQIKMQKIKEISQRLAAVLEESRHSSGPLDKLTLDLDSLESKIDYKMVKPREALPGRKKRMVVAKKHFVLGSNLEGPWPLKTKVIIVATGCFWGTEKGIWRLPGGGIHSTAAGYAAGYTPNPNYEEVCSGRTGATEAVQVVYYPEKISLVDILRWFWESHNPTQGMRQGNDSGTQYRSGLYYFEEEQGQLLEASKIAYQKALRAVGRHNPITTEIRKASEFTLTPGAVFYYAEDEHQQYLAKPTSRPYCSAEPLLVSLPPFNEWTPSNALSHHAPQLSEAFWKQHAPRPGCCVKAPSEPIKWV